MNDDKLTPLRNQIDAIDTQILSLLNQRARVAQEVGHVKAQTNAPIFRPEREAQVLRGIAEKNTGPLFSFDVQTVFREIMSACRALEKRVTVAFLGPVGTFSEQAVFQQFGRAVDALPCSSIDEVFRVTEANTADFGVVPIENSSEGVINRTLDLLLKTPLNISSEILIQVRHNLMNKNGSMEGVHAICAHSQALAQCQNWLNQHYPNIERRAVASNGEAARIASGDASIAAIAGEMASQEYHLEIVNAGIQDDPHNRTRFAMLGYQKTTPSGSDQTSLVLSVKNRPGAVYHLLAPLAKHGVSMTRFESRPARTGIWEYYFYVDIEGHRDHESVAAALTELEGSAAFFKILGSYPLNA
jgi:chorismate mutase / prephenate dehydratase